MYSYTYSDEDLKKLADEIRSLGFERNVYCLFNNISMREDAKRLMIMTEA